MSGGSWLMRCQEGVSEGSWTERLPSGRFLGKREKGGVPLTGGSRHGRARGEDALVIPGGVPGGDRVAAGELYMRSVRRSSGFVVEALASQRGICLGGTRRANSASP